MNWKPIDTAPKDGTRILVYYELDEEPFVHVARYETGKHQGFDKGWWAYIENNTTQTLLEEFSTPTHWMPLPEPPK